MKLRITRSSIPWSPRRSILLGAMASLLCGPAATHAASFTYSPLGLGPDLWSAGTNWSAVPVSDAATQLNFVGINTTVVPDNLAITSLDDLAGQFSLNLLNLQGTGPAAGGGTVTIGTSGAATGLSLVSNGATTPVVNLNAVAGTSGFNYNVNAPVIFEANTLFAGNGTAGFNFLGGITSTTSTLSKSGSSTLTVGGSSSLANLVIGNNLVGGKVTVASGAQLFVGSGSGNTLSIGTSAGTVASGTLDLSTAGGFAANVGTFLVGNSTGNVTAQGTLHLSASNDINASTSFVIGNTGSSFNNVLSTVTTAEAGSTYLRTPAMTIGGNKSRGEFILGLNAVLDLTGTAGGRSALVVGSTTAGGGSGSWSGLANFSGGVFRGTLNSLLVGNRTVTSSTAAVTGTMVLSADPANHLDINGTSATYGGVVVVGRYAATGGSATGTLIIGNLDFSSSIVSSNNGTAILVGTGAAASGTLNLDGGTLTITTTGSAIAGGGGTNSSVVNFNGLQLRAGASSANWITNLTAANLLTGGLLVDSNGFNLTTNQAFNGAGGITKSGNGQLTLTGANTYSGATQVIGGTLFATKTAALPNYATPGQVVVSDGGTLGFNIGGAGEFTLAEVENLRANGTFTGTHSIALDTTNAGGLTTYATNRPELYNLTKLGVNPLVLAPATQVTELGSLNIGINSNGGTVSVPGGSISVGTGFANNLNIGVTNTPAPATGTLNVSLAASFTANVANVVIDSAGNNSVTGGGSLVLPANNTITAFSSFVIANSAGAFNSVDSTVTTGNSGLTVIQTPVMTIGGTKSRGFFTLGTGSTLQLSSPGGRTFLAIGRSAIEGGSGVWSGSADFSAGVFQGTLSNLIVGHADAGSGTWTETGTLLMSNNAGNHLDIAGSLNPVIVGRWISGGAAAGVAASGTLTIGNLDATSSITALDDSTALLVGVGGVTGTQRAQGTVTFGGGTLTITTAGAAIAGDAVNASNVSTVHFNDITLKAGASSADWIHHLTNANLGQGGLRVDTDGHDLGISQAFVHSPAVVGADGGLTKLGAGTLTLTGHSTYTGPTTVSAGTLLINGTLTGSVGVVGGVLGGTGSVGHVTVGTGSTLAPGAGLGTMTVGALTFNGGTLSVDLDTSTQLHDSLIVTGALSLGIGAPVLSLTELGADTVLAENTKFTLLTYGGSWDSHLFQVNGAMVPDGGQFVFGSNLYRLDYNDGENAVSLTVVPEPAAAFSLLGGLGVLVARRRRRKA